MDIINVSRTSSDIINANIQAVEAGLASKWWAPDDPAWTKAALINAKTELLSDLDRGYSIDYDVDPIIVAGLSPELRAKYERKSAAHRRRVAMAESLERLSSMTDEDIEALPDAEGPSIVSNADDDAAFSLKEAARHQGVSIEEMQAIWDGSAQGKPPHQSLKEFRENKQAQGIKATPFVLADALKLPPRDWLYGKRLIRKYVSATFAPGGIGKSILEVVEALSMVTGIDVLDSDQMHPEPLRVWYINLEDPIEETRKRIAAACIHHGLTGDQIGGRLYADTGRDMALKIAVEDKKGKTEIVHPVIDRLIEELKAKRIDVLIIDPFVSCHSVSENDNSSIDLVAKEWSRIADECNCAVELVHHTRKNNGHGNYDVADGRGASALLNAVRSARVLNEMTDSDADKHGVDNHFLYFHAVVGKANLAVRNWQSVWFHLESVMLPNKMDEIGVPERWKPTSAAASVTPEQKAAIVEAIGDVPMHRYDLRSKGWVGHLIIEHMDWRNDKEVKSHVKKLIEDWIRDKTLKRVEAKDGNRETREYVVRDLVINLSK